MLVSHTAFLAQVSPEDAERLISEFEKTTNASEQTPQRCPWFIGVYIPRNAYRFILFEKHYMLIFQIVDDGVKLNQIERACGNKNENFIRSDLRGFISSPGEVKVKAIKERDRNGTCFNGRS